MEIQDPLNHPAFLHSYGTGENSEVCNDAKIFQNIKKANVFLDSESLLYEAQCLLIILFINYVRSRLFFLFTEI